MKRVRLNHLITIYTMFIITEIIYINVNIYDIYEDVCLSTASLNEAEQLMSYIAESDAPLSTFFTERMQTISKLKSGLSSLEQQPDPPCVENYLTSYLNVKAVQTAIHANISYPWSQCSPRLDYSRKDLLTPILEIYRKLIGQVRILVYSGDVDAIVPTTGTKMWIEMLDLKVSKPFKPWTAPDGQVGGYVTVYDGLTFNIVRDAGHMVPGTQPLRALTMFSKFLQNEPF